MSPTTQLPRRLEPSLAWRIKSAVIMGVTGIVSRFFLFGLNRMEVTGLPGFLDVLQRRQDPDKRQRGLLTGAHGPLPLSIHIPRPEFTMSLITVTIFMSHG